ncbi:MAG TPA: hypothetical protein VGD37_04110 [Kofleriaceae bacterium]
MVGLTDPDLPLREDLLRSLAEAFRAARQPARLWEVGEASENPAFRELAGKRRDEVTFDTVWRLRRDLGRFERPGLRYYLPCFLCAAFVDREIAACVIAYLARGPCDRDALWPSEKRAVRDVLIELRDREAHAAAGAALTAYWDAPEIAADDELREQVVRRILAGFAGDAAAAEIDPREVERLGVDELAALGAVELRRRLPALLLSVPEKATAGIVALLSPSETPDRGLIDRLAAMLSRGQAGVVRDVLRYARTRNPERWSEDDAQFWAARARRRAPAS